jgi:hypothetical protein
MIYTVEVEKELVDFKFQGKAELIACAVDCFKDLNGLNPWVFLNDILEEKQVKERKVFTEREINDFMHFSAIPLLLEYDFEPYDINELLRRCDKAYYSIRCLL